MKRVLLLLPLVALLACDSAVLPARPSEDVYEFRLATSPPLVLRWESGRTVRVYVAAAAGSVLEESFGEAAAEWNRHAWFGEYRLVQTNALTDADVVLRWFEDPSPVDLSVCPPTGVRAVTTFCGVSEDPRAGLVTFPRAEGGASRVKMVVSVSASQATTPDRVRAFVTHELGHVLGIVRHSPDTRDLMYGGELSTDVLSRRDAATVQVLYQMRADITP